jgi:hypothetical protein
VCELWQPFDWKSMAGQWFWCTALLQLPFWSTTEYYALVRAY